MRHCLIQDTLILVDNQESSRRSLSMGVKATRRAMPVSVVETKTITKVTSLISKKALMDETKRGTDGGGKIPSHLLVQKQMQDLIAWQKARVSSLENDVSSQNETIRDYYVSRDQYDTDVSKLQESLRNDYVPKRQYELAVSELEEEKIEHAQTRLRLREMESKLEQAFDEVGQLSEQLEAERAAFEKACNALKGKNVQGTAKTMKLESQYAEITQQCERQEDILLSKNHEIQMLEKRLRDKEQVYRKEMSEADIEKKQQRYIAKLMEEQEKKQSRATGHQAVPKTKLVKR